MATSPIPTWAREQSPYHHGPTGGGVLLLALLVVMAVLILTAWPTTQSGAQPTRPTTPPPCARHWPPTCPEGARGTTSP